MKRFWFVALLLGLAGGCASGEAAPSAEAETASVAVEEAKFVMPANAAVVEFNVSGMSCEHHCAALVKATLKATPGVAKVDVDFPKKVAKMTVDADTFDTDAALAKLDEAGYKATVVEAN